MKHYYLPFLLTVGLLSLADCGKAQTSLIAAGASWKFLDDGSDQGTVWRDAAFDDSGWSSGLAQLGFGDGDEITVINGGPAANRFITIYFRKSFDVIDPAAFSSLNLRLLRDDGGVVYMNGVEVFRSNMPSNNPILFDTLAANTALSADETTTFYLTNVPSNLLVPGANVMAVEIHQYTATSSDLSFDLELTAPLPLPLTLAITNISAGSATIIVHGEPGGSVRIENSLDVTGPWATLQTDSLDAAGTLPIVVSTTAARQFYRALNFSGPVGSSYSLNAVGYVKLSVPIGTSFLANPLLAADNRVAALLSSVPAGIRLFKWIHPGDVYVANDFLSSWSDSSMMLLPGEGCAIDNPTATPFDVTFVGEVLQGNLTNHLADGFSLCSSMVPQIGGLEATLGFPAQDGDNALFWNNAAQAFTTFLFLGSTWRDEMGTITDPMVQISQSFFVVKSSAADWLRAFTAEGSGPSLTVTQGLGGIFFDVSFFTYQPDPTYGRVFDVDNMTALSASFRGQLYAGSAPNELTLNAAGLPAPFNAGSLSGYINAGGVSIGGGGPTIYLQLRVWAAVDGTSYETALAKKGKTGKSGVFAVARDISPPAANGFLSFQLDSPPQITTQPQSQTNVTPGATIMLSVQASGSAPLSYQWRLNGVNIPGETNSTLVLMNVQPPNSGSYSVGVANPVSAVNSSNAIVRVDAPPLLFSDNFAAAITLNAPGFVGRGDNLGATVQPDEPNLVGRLPRSSVWLNWVAPLDPGIVTFSTAGSSFDTLLAAYTGPALGALTAVAGDDDRGGFHTSRIQFNVAPGTLYHIAVGSLLSEQGDIVLSGDFQPTSAVLPVIIAQPAGQIVNVGGTATFSVAASGAGLSYQWFFNGGPLPGAAQPDLIRNNVQLSDLGSYYVEVTAGLLTVDSDRATLQINTGGDNALARDKFADVVSDAGGLSPPGFVASKSAVSGRPRKSNVVRGYTGTQGFNSFGAGKDAEEPNHCGVLGGASELFCYAPTNSGRLFINTDGSLFNTVLAVYTGPGDSYATLSPVACDNNSGLDQVDSSLSFEASAATNYWIFVDDVAGIGGAAVVNYRLETPLRFSAPAFTNGVCFCFKLTGTPGLNASIQMSTNMTSWVTMHTNLLSTVSGSFTYTDTNAPASRNRFYRAVYHP